MASWWSVGGQYIPVAPLTSPWEVVNLSRVGRVEAIGQVVSYYEL